MLQDLIRMWKKIDLLQQALDDFLRMIDDVDLMFHTATDAMFAKLTCDAAAESIYRMDIRVNKTERNIRKQLVEHLAVNPHGDAPACLILMSVSKDAERAGDYCKNLLGVARTLHDPVAGLKYADELRKMADDVAAAFGKTRRAFAESNHGIGHDVIVQEVEISHRSDAMVDKIANDNELNANQAVCLALAFRFLKRVSAHLGNIASSVVMPLHKIDYFDEKWRTPKQEAKALKEAEGGEKKHHS